MTGLDEAILTALTPHSVRERLRVGLGGGYTVLQVYERLPDVLRARLGEGEPDPVRAARQGTERVRAVLGELVRAGNVGRHTRKMTVVLGSKGPRDVVVDVFRLR